jgi:hypothetical protein
MMIEKPGKLFFWFCVTLSSLSTILLIYAGIGYYVTLGKIEETCHEALAFKDPTPIAKQEPADFLRLFRFEG